MNLHRVQFKPYALIIAAILLWEATALLGLVNPNILPSPQGALARLWEEAAYGTLFSDIIATASRHLQGFAIGAAAGLAFGFWLGLSRLAGILFGPIFLGFRQIAMFAWVPLLSLWFGGNEAGKIAFIAVAAFPATVFGAWRGTRDIAPAHHDLARVLKLGRLDYAWLIALPSAMPQALTGLRHALIQSWLAAIGAELFLNVAPGLGGRLNEGRETFQMDLLLAIVFVLVLLGMIYQRAADAAETALLKRRTAQ